MHLQFHLVSPSLYCTEKQRSFLFQVASVPRSNSAIKVNILDILWPTGLEQHPDYGVTWLPPLSKWCLPITYFPSTELTHLSLEVGVRSCSITKVGLLPVVSWRHKGRGGERGRGRIRVRYTSVRLTTAFFLYACTCTCKNRKNQDRLRE